jgi:hypothetical protein
LLQVLQPQDHFKAVTMSITTISTVPTSTTKEFF